MPIFGIKCPMCQVQHLDLVDVNPDDDVRKYEDSEPPSPAHKDKLVELHEEQILSMMASPKEKSMRRTVLSFKTNYLWHRPTMRGQTMREGMMRPFDGESYPRSATHNHGVVSQTANGFNPSETFL